jgi:hypothetical protein
MKIQKFPNGLKVSELRALLADWPDTDPRTGEPSEVWIMTADSTSNDVEEVCPLNSVDILFVP